MSIPWNPNLYQQNNQIITNFFQKVLNGYNPSSADQLQWQNQTNNQANNYNYNNNNWQNCWQYENNSYRGSSSTLGYDQNYNQRWNTNNYRNQGSNRQNKAYRPSGPKKVQKNLITTASSSNNTNDKKSSSSHPIVTKGKKNANKSSTISANSNTSKYIGFVKAGTIEDNGAEKQLANSDNLPPLHTKPKRPPIWKAGDQVNKEQNLALWKEYRTQMKAFKNKEFANAKRSIQRLGKLPYNELEESSRFRLDNAREIVAWHKEVGFKMSRMTWTKMSKNKKAAM